MTNYSYLMHFFYEFALAFFFVSFLLAAKKPSYSKIIKKMPIGIFALFPFYTNMFNLNALINALIMIIFLLWGFILFIQTINYRGKMEAINDYNNKSQIPKYHFNDTMVRINNFIYTVLVASIIALIPIFLTKTYINTIIGIIYFLIIFVIMGNHFSKGHVGNTSKFDGNMIKTNLITLLSLTLIFSIMLFHVLVSVSLDFSFLNLLSLFPIIAFFVSFPSIYISNYFLDHLRFTFYKDKKFADFFISNILKYFVASIIITIILSDIVVMQSIMQGHDILGMIYWVNGFVIFIAIYFQTIIKKSNLYQLEAKLKSISDIKKEIYL